MTLNEDVVRALLGAYLTVGALAGIADVCQSLNDGAVDDAIEWNRVNWRLDRIWLALFIGFALMLGLVFTTVVWPACVSRLAGYEWRKRK